MEFLEEHEGLRTSISDQAVKEGLTEITPTVGLELTPAANRKNSDFVINELNQNIQTLIGRGSTIVIGICGGQNCGKSSISLYLKKHLSKTVILSEKDFFVGVKDRKKSTVDEKMSVLNMTDDDYSVTRKHRLHEVNTIKNFDWDCLKNVILSIKDGKTTSIPTWDKEKNIQ